jgi:hypothetical protein
MAGVVDHPPAWDAGHGLRRVDEPVAVGIAENHRQPEGLIPADAPRQFGEARLVDLAVEKRRGREGAQDVDLRRELAFQKDRDALHMIARLVLDRILLVAQPGDAEGRRQHHERQQGRDHEEKQRATAVNGSAPESDQINAYSAPASSKLWPKACWPIHLCLCSATLLKLVKSFYVTQLAAFGRQVMAVGQSFGKFGPRM